MVHSLFAVTSVRRSRWGGRNQDLPLWFYHPWKTPKPETTHHAAPTKSPCSYHYDLIIPPHCMRSDDWWKQYAREWTIPSCSLFFSFFDLTFRKYFLHPTDFLTPMVTYLHLFSRPEGTKYWVDLNNRDEIFHSSERPKWEKSVCPQGHGPSES